ncbi:MAG: hypothetical protein WBA74_20405, partial [Cyclobacteriaceae bacterium]
MKDSLQHISLLYELSVTTLRHLDPYKTAENFIKKFLSRKNLTYGAIWLIDQADEEHLYFSNLYSMPDLPAYSKCRLNSFAELFGDNLFGQSEKSLLRDIDLNGNFFYYKLNEI